MPGTTELSPLLDDHEQTIDETYLTWAQVSDLLRTHHATIAAREFTMPTIVGNIKNNFLFLWYLLSTYLFIHGATRFPGVLTQLHDALEENVYFKVSIGKEMMTAISYEGSVILIEAIFILTQSTVILGLLFLLVLLFQLGTFFYKAPAMKAVVKQLNAKNFGLPEYTKIGLLDLAQCAGNERNWQQLAIKIQQTDQISLTELKTTLGISSSALKKFTDSFVMYMQTVPTKYTQPALIMAAALGYAKVELEVAKVPEVKACVGSSAFLALLQSESDCTRDLQLSLLTFTIYAWFMASIAKLSMNSLFVITYLLDLLFQRLGLPFFDRVKRLDQKFQDWWDYYSLHFSFLHKTYIVAGLLPTAIYAMLQTIYQVNELIDVTHCESMFTVLGYIFRGSGTHICDYSAQALILATWVGKFEPGTAIPFYLLVQLFILFVGTGLTLSRSQSLRQFADRSIKKLDQIIDKALWPAAIIGGTAAIVSTYFAKELSDHILGQGLFATVDQGGFSGRARVVPACPEINRIFNSGFVALLLRQIPDYSPCNPILRARSLAGFTTLFWLALSTGAMLGFISTTALLSLFSVLKLTKNYCQERLGADQTSDKNLFGNCVRFFRSPKIFAPADESLSESTYLLATPTN